MPLSLKPTERERALSKGLIKSGATPTAPRPQQPKPRGKPSKEEAVSRIELAVQAVRDLFDTAEWEPPVLPRFPYAVGVRHELLAWPKRRQGVCNERIGVLLGRVIQTRAYKRSLTVEGARRYHADGSDAGPVEPEAVEHAKKWLEELDARQAAKAAAKEPT